MKELFKTLMPEIEAIQDKIVALDDIRSKKWPLKNKPKWYFELGDNEAKKNIKDSMELNHYIKSYLQRLLNL